MICGPSPPAAPRPSASPGGKKRSPGQVQGQQIGPREHRGHRQRRQKFPGHPPPPAPEYFAETLSHAPEDLSTNSLMSRTAPHPPRREETKSASDRTYSSASATVAANPTCRRSGTSTRSSPT